MTDSEQLEWLVRNRALVHTCPHTDRPYWVVYRDGTTSDSRATVKAAIEIAALESGGLGALPR